ncbi:hypothetical protein [Amycolatopsis sp. NBC_01480]|uniref:hypothetical protein n=1 Tax=Amycolatopsis sp. NBC_01480 TaxID=2903562 RepID=UPI002E28B725|nr:hypothetical protein [Amycolatopsis sp. NBC_01480]
MSRLSRFAVPAVLVAGSLCLVMPAAHATTTVAHTPAARAASCSQSYLPLPDPACTPGATNPDVTQATIGSTICVSGWTATVRPPTSYTNALKKQGIADYGYKDTNMSDYEEDHFLPLEVGGAPRDPKNLWPEPHSGNENSRSKDSVENAVKKAVCAKKATLSAAQHALLTDWTTAESVLGIG